MRLKQIAAALQMMAAAVATRMSWLVLEAIYIAMAIPLRYAAGIRLDPRSRASSRWSPLPPLTRTLEEARRQY